jgi:hypothetical protein
VAPFPAPSEDRHRPTAEEHPTEELHVTVPDQRNITTDMKSGDHLCVLYSGQAERDRVLLPYLRGGVRAGDKCLYATSDADASEMLADLGHDTGLPAAVRSGQLEMRAAADPSGRPDGSALTRLITLWDTHTRAALDDGYGFARLGAEARCWMSPTPDAGTFLRYESELSRYLPTHPQTALCLFDMSYFDGSVVVDVVKFHPRVMIDGLLVENPYYLDVGGRVANTSVTG